MKIVYLGRSSQRMTVPPKVEGDAIELFSNSWDDYGHETSFPVSCRIKEKLIDLGLIRVLVEGEDNTSDYLDRLLGDGWNGEFPIPKCNYISTPSEITFYQQIKGVTNGKEALEIAKKLRDSSYFIKIGDDKEAQRLILSQGFKSSLQRERGSVTAFLDGWKIFQDEEIIIEDLGFEFYDSWNNLTKIELKFGAEKLFPHDINALIGPNGVGKSQLLQKIVEAWIEPQDGKDIGFTELPHLSQLIVVSYSPFELFPVDLKRYDKKISDSKIYKYFGLRGRATSASEKSGGIRLSHTFPKRHSAISLIACLEDDKKYGYIDDWSNKVASVESVLKVAFDFDFCAVEVSGEISDDEFYDDFIFVDVPSVQDKEGEKIKKYIPISSNNMEHINEVNLKSHVISSSGVNFFKDEKILHLSSGQKLFTFIVINILGAIRNNSLILVDEHELFLHPTLEIKFIELLKDILERYNSKALIATHSVVSVREIPTECIHVFSQSNDELVIKTPPFQTFGGDIQRISSYVFGDNATSKPFESWLKKKKLEFGSGKAFLEALGENVNEELRIQIAMMEE